MSINPVEGIGPASEAQVAAANLRPAPAQSSAGEAERPAQPDPGTRPSQEARIPQNASTTADLPQDEVQVQRDSQADDEIVIKYVDHAGNLILQVPSSEVLGLTRAIAEDFQQEAKVRNGSAQSDSQGEKPHGH
jgi:hypothetical protein